MTITITPIYIPIALTVVFLIVMFRPYQKGGDYDFGAIARILWAVPIAITWMVFGIIVYYRGAP